MCLAVDSVLNQSYKNYEIIVVDDGSTDDTFDVIAKRFGSAVRYVHMQNSGGPASPRNVGIKIAQGDWVAFLDADDVWYPNKLHEIVKCINNDPQIDIVTHDVDLVDERGLYGKYQCGPKTKNIYRELLVGGNMLSTSATAIKRKILINGRIFFREEATFTGVEDYDLWLTLAKANYKFQFLNASLGAYHIYTDSLSNQRKKMDFNRLNVVCSHIFNSEHENIDRGLVVRTVDYQLIKSEIAELKQMNSYIRLISILFTEGWRYIPYLINSAIKKNKYIIYKL